MFFLKKGTKKLLRALPRPPQAVQRPEFAKVFCSVSPEKKTFLISTLDEKPPVTQQTIVFVGNCIAGMVGMGLAAGRAAATVPCS